MTYKVGFGVITSMKLIIDETKSQGDPYVIKANGAYYMYATHENGVQLYKSWDKYTWDFLGFCFQKDREKEFWAPSVLEINGRYYLYYSSMSVSAIDAHDERLCVAVSDFPEGPFTFIRELAQPFSIDPHVVESDGELFMFYSINDYEAERAGTLIVVDKMKSPTEMCGQPKIVLRATLDEEIFMKDRFKKGQHWHTLEGAFYFRKDDYHYLMYSGNSYESEYYYIGYAVCCSKEKDLTKLTFLKYPDEKTYSPLICKNDKEEGTGHNSLLEDNGKYYVFYHARDWGKACDMDVRTARICEVLPKKELLLAINR